MIGAVDLTYIHWTPSVSYDLKDWLDASANALPSECAVTIHHVHLFLVTGTATDPDHSAIYQELMGEKYSAYPLTYQAWPTSVLPAGKSLEAIPTGTLQDSRYSFSADGILTIDSPNDDPFTPAYTFGVVYNHTVNGKHPQLSPLQEFTLTVDPTCDHVQPTLQPLADITYWPGDPEEQMPLIWTRDYDYVCDYHWSMSVMLGGSTAVGQAIVNVNTATEMVLIEEAEPITEALVYTVTISVTIKDSGLLS